MFRAALAGVLSIALAAASLALPRPTAAQEPGPDREKMAKLLPLLGRWEGRGTLIQPNGERETFHQTENVQEKLDGAAVLVEGRGTRPNTNPAEVVFQALAVMVYDRPSGTYKVHAFRHNGLSVLAEARVTETGLVWGFKDPRGVSVRYTITLTADRWEEVGEYSRDEKNWSRFIELDLKRVPRN